MIPTGCFILSSSIWVLVLRSSSSLKEVLIKPSLPGSKTLTPGYDLSKTELLDLHWCSLWISVGGIDLLGHCDGWIWKVRDVVDQLVIIP